MPYSLRNRNGKASAPLVADKLAVASPKRAKASKGAIHKKKALSKIPSESKHTQIKGAIIRPSLPISDAKQRLIKELSNVTGKPSDVKQKTKEKKKVLLHKIDFSSSGKIQKKSRLDGKQLTKIVLGEVRKLDPNITPSIVKARTNSSSVILAIQTEILKKAVLKEIRSKSGGKSAAKSPIKSPLKGR